MSPILLHCFYVFSGSVNKYYVGTGCRIGIYITHTIDSVHHTKKNDTMYDG